MGNDYRVSLFAGGGNASASLCKPFQVPYAGLPPPQLSLPAYPYTSPMTQQPGTSPVVLFVSKWTAQQAKAIPSLRFAWVECSSAHMRRPIGLKLIRTRKKQSEGSLAFLPGQIWLVACMHFSLQFFNASYPIFKEEGCSAPAGGCSQ